MTCAFCKQEKKLFQSLHDGKHPRMWCGKCPEGLKVKIELLKEQSKKGK